MLRTAQIAAVLIAFNTAAADAPPEPLALTKILAAEDKDIYDPKLDAAGQIDAAKKRFYGYRDNLCKTPEDTKATRDCFNRVLDRIMERAQQRVREAEERQERLRKRHLKDSVAT